MDEADIRKLQTQGKLAFLTHSQPVIERLQRDLRIEDPAELVAAGLLPGEPWKAEVQGLAGGDEAELEALIPPTYAAGASTTG